MTHDHEDDGEPMVFVGGAGLMGASEFQQQAERAQMAHEAFGRDFRRMIFEELDDDQLGTVNHLFRMLGAADPARLEGIVSWYEGILDGASHARRRARDLEPAEPSRACHPFVPDADDPVTFWACTARWDGVICGKDRGDEPHRKWDAGEQLG